jgi:hypothetical protein
MSDRMKQFMQKHQERLAKQAAEKSARLESFNKAPGENIDEFEKSMECQFKEVEEEITKNDLLQAQCLLKSASEQLNRSTYFLPSYTVKQTQNVNIFFFVGVQD